MTQETRRDLRFPLLAFATLSVALATAVPSALAYPIVPGAAGVAGVLSVALLVVAAVVSEALIVLVPGSGAISLGVPLFVAVAVYAGPSAAALTGSMAAIASILGSRPRQRPVVAAFNFGNAVLTTTLPALLYLQLGGSLLAAGESVTGRAVLPFLVAAVFGTVVNLGLGGLAVSALHGQSLLGVWRETFSWMLPSQLVLGFVGLAIALVLGALGAPGFALFVLPLLVARQTYQQSVSLREAYADTIRSLVAALEAKDVYTKGHSLRVAEYTVIIGEALGLGDEKIRRLEQAALLHDLGKVGVSRRVLAKEAKLTDAEYAEIKRHPDIGARILADVPYLADLVPAIQAHHKRYDGGGYGGEAGVSEAPFEARILAVADSYDAMTSARPYRGAMSHKDALAELHRNSGTQFDPEAVAAFERGYGRHAEASPDDTSSAQVLDEE